MHRDDGLVLVFEKEDGQQDTGICKQKGLSDRILETVYNVTKLDPNINTHQTSNHRESPSHLVRSRTFFPLRLRSRGRTRVPAQDWHWRFHSQRTQHSTFALLSTQCQGDIVESFVVQDALWHWNPELRSDRRHCYIESRILARIRWLWRGNENSQNLPSW